MTIMETATDPELRERLEVGLAALGLSLDAQKRDQLLGYVALLDKWNKVYNLTAVREPERMIGLHILDSLSILAHLGAGSSVLDVGTGGGLPGIPIAIADPARRVTMLDAIAKKTAFVRQAIGELGLNNATIVTSRVEDFSQTHEYAHGRHVEMVVRRRSRSDAGSRQAPEAGRRRYARLPRCDVRGLRRAR